MENNKQKAHYKIQHPLFDENSANRVSGTFLSIIERSMCINTVADCVCLIVKTGRFPKIRREDKFSALPFLPNCFVCSS